MASLLRFSGIEPKSCSIDLSSGRVHYLTVGQGHPVVLVHGAGGGAANWYRVFGRLGREFRLFAPDLPAFGLSDAVPLARQLGAQTAELLLIWADRIGLDRFDAVGTSFGGLAVLRMAQQAPERIRRIVLLDSVGLSPDVPVAVRAAALPVIGPTLLQPTRPGTAWLFRNLLVAEPGRFDRAEREALVDYLWASARVAAPVMATALRRFTGARGQREVLTDAELASVRHSVLILWGDCDRFVPLSHGERAARLLPEGSLRVIRGAGHSPNWERPDEVTQQIQSFLTP